jgi:hypothetical protein
MMIRSDDGVKVRVNGSTWTNNTSRAYYDAEDRVQTSLVSGWNRILIKIHNGVYGFGFACRFVTRGTNTPVTGLAYQLNRPPDY